MKILLKVPLSTSTGYGSDGVYLAQSLLKAGYDVYLHPTEVQAPIPEEVARLLAKPLIAPFDLTIVHLDPSRLEIDSAEKLSTKRVVVWSMWEWDSFNNLKGRSKLRKNLKDYDAVLAYDEVTAKCFSEYYNGPIHVLQGGYNAREMEYFERDWNSDVMRFCMLGQLSIRKNPYVAIQAFSELCEEDPNFKENSRLVLKTIAPPEYFVRMEEVYPNLRIIYENWSREVLEDFYQHMHVLLAPSFGEGKNLPALEFMTTGGAVIATNWGGMANWMNEDYAYPLEYDIDYIDSYSDTAKAARVRVESLKAQMHRVFYNREEAKQKGLLASQVIPSKYSWDVVVNTLINEVVPKIPARSMDNGKEG